MITFRYYHTPKGRHFSSVIGIPSEALPIFRRFDDRFDEWSCEFSDGTIASHPPTDHSWSLSALQMALVNAGYRVDEAMICPNNTH